MLRNERFEDISDGRKYGLNDMVKADCRDCVGCFKCCGKEMGESILLDPYDIFQITKGTGKTFESMLDKEIALSVIDGLILPHINAEAGERGCGFLNEEGRCSIHPFRPSVCRLFPLGRIYENGSFSYFLQVNECVMKNRTKVKVSKWIDIPDIEENTEFIKKWHNFTNFSRKKISEASDEKQIRNYMLYILELFYVMEYDPERDFYEQFNERLKNALHDRKLILR